MPVLHSSGTNSSACTFVVKGENLILFLFLLLKDWGLTPWKIWKNYYHQLCVVKGCFSSLSSSVIFTVIHFFITLALLWAYVLEALLLLPVLLLLLLLLLSRSVCPTLSDPIDCPRLLHPWDFPGKSTGVGCHCLLRLLTVN